MPSKHRYKCLNPNCPGYTEKVRTPIFISMNSPQPTCPQCGSIKVEDWGEAINPMIGGQGGARQMDADMRQLADNLGMTNMSNKDGKAMKGGSATDAKGEMGHIRLPGGVTAPVDYTPKCSNIGLTSEPLKLKTGAAFAGKPTPGQSIPTQVVAAYKGTA